MTTPMHRVQPVPLVVEGIAVVLTYTGLTLWLLRPLFAAPAHALIDQAPDYRGLPVAPDVNLILWVLAWDWHALTTQPWNLFNANAFHPAPSMLAGSEHMLGHLPIFGPIYGLSGNPVLANQVNVLAAFVLSAAGMYALLRHWGLPALAGLFGGFVYGFFPMRVFSVGHAHLIAGQYMPLALLYLDRTLIEAKLRAAAAFLLFLLLQMLCSYYLAYISMTVITGYACGVLWVTRGRMRAQGVLLACAAAILAGAVVGVLSLPYLQLKHLGIIPDHSRDEWLRLGSSGLWRNFLLPPVALEKWGCHLDRGVPSYVGIVALLLAIVGGVVPCRDPRGRWVRAAALGATIACYLLALGPEIVIGTVTVPLPYRLATAVIPGFSSMRAPARFGMMLMCGFAALSGLGLTRVLALLPLTRFGTALAVGVVLVLGTGTAAEYGLLGYRATLRRVELGAELPGVYRVLAQAEPGAVLEIPAGILPGEFERMRSESDAMLYSTFHWHPLLNGYSGYNPPTYLPVVTLARALPAARATEILARATGLRYIVVHFLALTPEQRERWRAPPGLRRVGVYESDHLFEVQNPPAPDLLPDFINFSPRSYTLLGTPLAPLPRARQQGEIVLSGAPSATVVAGTFFQAEVVVTNRSSVTWPALALSGDHLVTLVSRWEDDLGRVIAGEAEGARLPYDLRPGESVTTTLRALAPGQPGTMRLIVGLAQDAAWFPDVQTSIAVTTMSANRNASEVGVARQKGQDGDQESCFLACFADGEEKEHGCGREENRSIRLRDQVHSSLSYKAIGENEGVEREPA
jgi:hypothetical protein